jgi:quercetin dioxygenase-like cupin family protein
MADLISPAIIAASFWIFTANIATAQLMSRCTENSPERKGKDGCSIVEKKVLPEGLKGPVYWHIDRFDSAESARAAVGPTSVALVAAGNWWLLTIEPKTSDHHGGRHVTQVGPLHLPPASRYAMQVQSSLFSPGMYSLPHHHSGVEAVYVVEGEACFETPTRAAKLRKGETVALAGGTPMRAVVTGSARRHLLAVIVHDAAQLPTTAMAEHEGARLATCK